MKIASFFSGAGGLDLGFTNAGFELAYANDNWKGCWETFENNHGIKIDKRSIVDVRPEDIPDVSLQSPRHLSTPTHSCQR